MKPTLTDCIEELERERRARDRVYPRLIENKRLKPETADLHNARLERAIEQLKWLAANQSWIKTAHDSMRRAERETDWQRQIDDMGDGAAKTVAAVQAAFPDATVTDVRPLTERAA